MSNATSRQPILRSDGLHYVMYALRTESGKYVKEMGSLREGRYRETSAFAESTHWCSVAEASIHRNTLGIAAEIVEVYNNDQVTMMTVPE